MTRLMPKRFFLLGIILLMLGCGGEKVQTKNELLIGNWNSHIGNVYTMLTFRINGTWVSENKIEGNLSKIVVKRNQVEGQWELMEDRLRMIPNNTDEETEWEEGEPVLFEVVSLTPTELKLNSMTGKVRIWRKLGNKGDTDGAAEDLVLPLAPIVVNLMKNRRLDKNRFLCVDMAFQIEKDSVPTPLGSSAKPAETAEPAGAPIQDTLPPLHPEIREIILFYLSGLTYKEVKDYDRIDSVKKDLTQVLRPYLDFELKEIKINQIISTTNRENVDEFLSGFLPAEPQIPEGEGGAGSDGQKTDGDKES